MVAAFEEIEDLSENSLVRFFTVRFNDDDPEMQKFDNKHFPGREAELGIIYNIIDQIKLRKAKSFFFRNEGPADALPPIDQQMIDANENNDFGLRLYCIRLTDELVILLNGDIKTSLNPKDCPNVRIHFNRAQAIARKIDKAITEKRINLQDPNPFDGFEIEI